MAESDAHRKEMQDYASDVLESFFSGRDRSAPHGPRADRPRQGAEAERTRAETERTRAEVAEAELTRLRAELARLRGEA